MFLKEIRKSSRPEKRFQALFCMCDKLDACCGKNYKLVHFGQKGGQTYIDHGDKDKKEAYIARHKPNEDWSDPTAAGTLAKYILWGSSTNMRNNIKMYKKKFGV